MEAGGGMEISRPDRSASDVRTRLMEAGRTGLASALPLLMLPPSSEEAIPACCCFSMVLGPAGGPLPSGVVSCCGVMVWRRALLRVGGLHWTLGV